MLEVMVAIGLMGVIMTLIWSSTSQSMRSKDRTEARDAVFHSAQVALRKISDDVSAVFLSPRAIATGTGTDVTTRTVPYKTFFMGEDRGERDSLRFTSLSHMRLVKNSKECDQTRIAYEMVPNPDDNRLYNVVRREQPWLGDRDEVVGRSFAILEGVLSFNLEYYDERKREWVKDWNTDAAENRDKLPVAMRVSVVFPDPDGGDRDIPFSTAVILAMWKNPISF